MTNINFPNLILGETTAIAKISLGEINIQLNFIDIFVHGIISVLSLGMEYCVDVFGLTVKESYSTSSFLKSRYQ